MYITFILIINKISKNSKPIKRSAKQFNLLYNFIIKQLYFLNLKVVNVSFKLKISVLSKYFMVIKRETK